MSPRDQFAILPSGEIRINDRPRIDLVREVELCFAQEEYSKRNTRGENLSKMDLIAGDYSYLPPWMVMFPSKHLLDEPYRIAEEGFILKPEDSRRGKPLFLVALAASLSAGFCLLVSHLQKLPSPGLISSSFIGIGGHITLVPLFSLARTMSCSFVEPSNIRENESVVSC